MAVVERPKIIGYFCQKSCSCLIKEWRETRLNRTTITPSFAAMILNQITSPLHPSIDNLSAIFGKTEGQVPLWRQRVGVQVTVADSCCSGSDGRKRLLSPGGVAPRSVQWNHSPNSNPP